MSKVSYGLRMAGVNLCRLVLAGAFIFSGFVKLVDPRGTQYKLEDYFAAFGVSPWVPEGLPLVLSVVLSVTEFCLGIFLLFGIRRRSTSALLLAFMGVFTPLSLYLALADPVADCGCFGDAWILSNWQTFGKNVVLLVAAVVAVRGRLLMMRFISERNQWMISMYSILFAGVLSGWCLYHLPVLDFRPYHIGADLRQGMEGPEGSEVPQYETTFILEKDGVRKEFSLDDYPDSTWTFVDSKTVLLKAGAEPAIHDFSMLLLPEGDDITEAVLSDKGYTFLLVAPYLEQADDSRIDRINELYDYCVEHDYSFYGLTASIGASIVRWQDLTGAEYPFCNTDEVTLKTIVRSNPGLLLLKDGVVLNKWSYADLPSEYDLTGPLDELPLARLQPGERSMQIFRLLLWYLVPLLLCTFADRIWVGSKMYKRFKHKNRILTRLKRKEHEKENRSR